MNTAKYYDEVNEKTSLTQCKQDIKDGKVKISDVPRCYRDMEIYHLAYTAASTEEEKEEINKYLDEDCKKLDNIEKEKLYSVYVDFNREKIKAEKEKYYTSYKCIDDLADGKITISEVPFEYRTGSHYEHAFMFTFPQNFNFQEYPAEREKKIIKLQLLCDIIRCREEGLKEKERDLLMAEANNCARLLDEEGWSSLL